MPGAEIPSARRPTAVVGLPGTGSDADYVRRAFGPAAADLGVDLIAVEPTDDLVDGYRAALDAAAADHRPVIVAGVSLGAAVAVEWAVRHAGDRHRDARCAGVWAALPAWSGSPDGAPAAWSARATADRIDADGLDATIAAMTASSPRWLADELGRSWRALFPGLPGHLRAAGNYHAPDTADLATLAAPLAVTAAVDDPIHPVDVGRSWCAAAPVATITEVTLAAWGADPAVLGNACLAGWRSLSGQRLRR